MFYGPGQQPGLIAPNAAGRGGLPFAPQQGILLPGMQTNRPGQFAGVQAQQGGRGTISGAQQVPPGAFGMPGQLPFGPMPQAGPGGFPNGIAYPQALTQVQNQLGRGGQGGRGQPQNIQGAQAIPQQMIGLQGVRGRDGRPYPAQPARGGIGANTGVPPGQIAGLSQQGRNPGIPPLAQQGMMQAGGLGSGSISIDTINSAPPGQRKQLLGEILYPKIQVMQPELAGKITGMLLEMDNEELVTL